MKNLEFEISNTIKIVKGLSRIIIFLHVPNEFTITETSKDWFLKCVDSIPWKIWRNNHNGIWISKRLGEYEKERYACGV